MKPNVAVPMLHFLFLAFLLLQRYLGYAGDKSQESDHKNYIAQQLSSIHSSIIVSLPEQKGKQNTKITIVKNWS